MPVYMEAINNKIPLWKWLLLLIAVIFLSFLGYGLMMAGQEVACYVLKMPVLTVVAAAAVLGLYALFVKWIEKHWPTDLPLRKAITHTLLGMLVGLVLMTLVVSVITAMGYATITWKGFSGGHQFLELMLFLAVAVGEEIMSRGVLFRWLDERWNVWVALIISSLFFGVGHIGNDNATWWATLAIAIEAGLLLGAAYKWSGTLWVPIGIHWSWNYVQGNVFGLAVSGNNAGYTILSTAVDGPDIITGGPFGPEASIIAVILGTFTALVFLRTRYRH